MVDFNQTVSTASEGHIKRLAISPWTHEDGLLFRSCTHAALHLTDDDVALSAHLGGLWRAGWVDSAGFHTVGLVPATQCEVTLPPPLVAVGQRAITSGWTHKMADISKYSRIRGDPVSWMRFNKQILITRLIPHHSNVFVLLFCCLSDLSVHFRIKQEQRKGEKQWTLVDQSLTATTFTRLGVGCLVGFNYSFSSKTCDDEKKGSTFTQASDLKQLRYVQVPSRKVISNHHGGRDRKWHHNSPNELNYFTLTFLRGLQPQEKLELQNWFWLYLLRDLDHSGVLFIY